MSIHNKNLLRALPSVDTLLNHSTDLIVQYGRDDVRDAIRTVLDQTRQQIIKDNDLLINEISLLSQVADYLLQQNTPSLREVINATGVIIHTNLGRAPLSKSALQAMQAVATGYSTLEYNLELGTRGSRNQHLEELLKQLTGAEAALVVNNNAAATVLALSALAHGKEVIVSRGQLVEIGGGFRVPEIMQQSGATLVEVGTTNRTRAADYRRAITEQTALLMHVHPSNFKQLGFIEETPLQELVHIAHEHGLIVLDDLGSGALIDTALYGLDHEPTVQESLAAGCDLVTFSGDKLLGGPQAGIILGRGDLIQQLKHHPLARAFRADKLCLAALYATLRHYRQGNALENIPIWQMITRPLADIKAQAYEWAQMFNATVQPGESTVGGGSLPGATLPTYLLAINHPQPDVLTAQLRQLSPPIIARITANHVVFDPRTILPEQTTLFTQLLKGIIP
ncbi:MAG: L-seryl-tRNA(Sec) selenium transferase [Phototrophicales bacterium]